MIVPAIHGAAGTISKNGPSNGLFFGDKIDTLHGYNPGDITAPRGYRRSFAGHGHAKRPGAYDPKVTRVGVAKQAPSTVGTTMVLGGMDEMKMRSLTRGAAGSRAAYATHAPRRAGPAIGAYVDIPNTPAMAVIETAFAHTGIPILSSKVTSLAHQVPNGIVNFDPIPAYPRVPIGSIEPGQSPVAQLVGTPGSVAGQSTDVGFRRGWSRTQNEGQRGLFLLPTEDSPLVGSDGVYGPGLRGCSANVEMPLSAPGTSHTTHSDGSSSGVAEPGHPTWMSPFGRAGSDARTGPRAALPSGHDAPIRAYERAATRSNSVAKGLFLAAAVLFGIRVLGGAR